MQGGFRDEARVTSHCRGGPFGSDVAQIIFTGSGANTQVIHVTVADNKTGVAVQADVMAVMAVADTAKFDILRAHKRY